MSVFSERLRALRTEKGILQAEIATSVGLKPQSYSAYENGREPNYDILIKLAEYFDCTTDYLLGLSIVRNEEAKKYNDETIEKINELGKIIESPVIKAFADSFELALAYDSMAVEANIMKEKDFAGPYISYSFIMLELHNLFIKCREYTQKISKNYTSASVIVNSFIELIGSLLGCKDNISVLMGYMIDVLLETEIAFSSSLLPDDQLGILTKIFHVLTKEMDNEIADKFETLKKIMDGDPGGKA